MTVGRAKSSRVRSPSGQEPGWSRSLSVLSSPAYSNRAFNPYNALLSDAVALAGGQVREFSVRSLLFTSVDVWHLHWPDHALHQPTARRAVLALLRFLTVLLLARLRRVRIVWTVHNAVPHEVRYPVLDGVLRAALQCGTDGWIALSSAAREEALQALPGLSRAPSWVIPHGDYRSSYAARPSRRAARRQLDLEPTCRVLLFLGLIRPYKNVPHLLRTFRAYGDPDLRLLIAGRPKDGLTEELEKLASDDDRVRLELRFVPDEEVPLFFAAADLTVVPFSRILNSGSVLLSLSFDTPVLVPSMGSMRELAEVVGPPWVNLFEGELEADDLRLGLEAATETSGSAPLDAFAWDTIGRQTLAAYEAVVRAPRDRRRCSRPRGRRGPR